jgi:hypothetical protein
MEDIEKNISFIQEKFVELKEQSTVMWKSFQASTFVDMMAKITSDRESGVGPTHLSTEVYQAMTNKPQKRKNMSESTLDNCTWVLPDRTNARLRLESVRESLADSSSFKPVYEKFQIRRTCKIQNGCKNG